MQIIESTAFGVRSAYSELVTRTNGPIIHLFPMIHLGDKSFYEDVHARAAKCDIVLVEGVRSRTSLLLTASYRYAIHNPKLGLVVQTKINETVIEGEIVHADVTREDFEEKWTELSVWFRMKIAVLAPLYGVYLRYFGTREGIAKNLGTELEKSREEILDEDVDWENAREILLDWRDSYLIDKIEEQVEKNPNSQKHIAIIYGAKHMRAVIKYLIDEKGYHIRNSEWISVIKLL